MFVSATLLFLVQPMVGKMVTPLLGGTPAVWNTCMVFYQALLLGGYFYAHRTTTNFDPKKQTSIHKIVLFAAVGALLLGAVLTSNYSPIPIVKSISPQGDDYPFFGVIILLTVAIGMPFFVVSTSAPLLQKWFAETGHPSAKDPYFLYAASNFGSLLALIAYPAVVEPNLRIIHQAWVWAIGYGILVALVLICAKQVRIGSPPPVRPVKPSAMRLEANLPSTIIDGSPPSLLRKMRWLALAFVPSSLMLGVTTFVSIDMGSIPLLWIIPLSLYLITFIVVFSKVPKELHVLTCLLMPVAVLLLVFVMTSNVTDKFNIKVLLHMATFFVVALVCHGELARDRPQPKYLTNFFLIMSLGGMLGGLFNALVAPIAFIYTSEYPITLVMACLMLPPMFLEEQKPAGSWTVPLDIVLPAAVFCLACWLQNNADSLGKYFYVTGLYILSAAGTFAVIGLAAVFLFERRARSRIVLGIFLGASLLLYAISGPLWDRFGDRQLLERLANATQSGWSRIGVSEQDQAFLPNATMAIRALASTVVAALVFSWYWRIVGEGDRFGKCLLRRLVAVAACFAGMLFLAAYFTKPEFLGNMAKRANVGEESVGKILIFGVPAMLCYFFVERSIRFAAAVAGLLLATAYTEYRAEHNSDKPERYRTYRDRSYFGQLKISCFEKWERISPDLFPEGIVEDKENYEVVEKVINDKEGSRTEIYFNSIRNKSYAYLVVRAENEGETQSVYYRSRDFMQLVHGNIIHGMQEMDKERKDIAQVLVAAMNPNWVAAAAVELKYGGEIKRALQFPGREPLTYYHRNGPIGSMFEAFNARNGAKKNPNTDVACIGLGTGTLSAYGVPGQTMTFYEIDTHVRRLVEPPTYFTYIDAAKKQGVNIEFVMGDARVTLERQDRKYGFMLIDAFSSDAIPAHLLTKESVELYFKRLEDDGLLAVHISNRYIELEPIVERICRELKLECRIMKGSEDRSISKYGSSWIAVAKTVEALGAIDEDTRDWLKGTNLSTDDRWVPLTPNDSIGLWTDDFSPIIPALRREVRFWLSDK
jgi:hypothetical protein